ncbi:hypothetical protein COLO4_19792 [Corchorus olitorius]|uniref:Uncharacterized protein n=1 Tax=Corchorus olitorius TaxID=93759 RepID=A0A1R3J3F6_9ROSI|nr:hypothetical protein COLO4_19792 [Corchorus olitorius]
MPPRVVQLRHPPGVVEPQPREELSETMQTFVNLIETQFLISYSSMTIEHSSEVQRDPSLRSIIKLLLRLIEEHTDCGAHGGLMLRTWLGLREHPYQNATNLMAMLSDHQILKKLYSRGIADLHPPRLSIHHTFQSIDLVTPEDRFTTISISGETKKTFLITSPPLSKAWLSLSSIINLANSSTVHRVDLMLDTTHTRFPDAEWTTQLSHSHLLAYVWTIHLS